MKIRTSFVSNSSSTSYIIGIKEPNEVIRAIFDEYDKDDLEDEEDTLQIKIRKTLDDGYKIFCFDVEYGGENDSMTKFVTRLRENKVDGAVLLYEDE